ncbi:histidine phosphatase family protein [Acidimicrobiia bacterium]|nr:histidine phosphatase family protein [Acidimicrobiia bacterium]MDB4249811.1 histidine phosphatase family protein [Acidimicrobiia bacterium]
MEIVLVRHGQPEWLKNNEYNLNPNLTEKGSLQAEMSSSIFQKNEVDKIWVSPLLRAQQTLEPFKKAGVSEDITVHEWLQEMRDSEEVDLIGKPNKEIEEFFIKRNSKSFEEWLVTNHGEYMKEFSDNIITNLGVSLNELGVVSLDNKYDRLFDLQNNETEKLMIISHAGTMSVLISYFLNMPLYPWTWRKFLPRHAGHTILKSTQISSGHFFRLKEFNNVSFMNSDELKTY